MSRSVFTDPADNAPPKADRRIAQTLERAGCVDVAYHLYLKTQNESLLQKTAGEYHIDQFWVSKPLAPAIINYWVVDSPKEASDHKGIAFQLDTELIDFSDPWSYR